MDRVRLGEPRTIEWNLHSWGEFFREAEDTPPQWVISVGQATKLRVLVFEPLPVLWVTGQSEFVPAYPHDGTRDSFLRLSATGREARFVWVLLLSNEAPPVARAGGSASLQFPDGMCTRFDGRWITTRGVRETEA
jgi:hypothetical protein